MFSREERKKEENPYMFQLVKRGERPYLSYKWKSIAFGGEGKGGGKKTVSTTRGTKKAGISLIQEERERTKLLEGRKENEKVLSVSAQGPVSSFQGKEREIAGSCREREREKRERKDEFRYEKVC